MDRVVFESVQKKFRHRPALFNWLGTERGGETVALKNAAFSVGPAEVLVLLGPNGSGKTTSLKLISTMLLPDAGSVRVGGSIRSAMRARCAGKLASPSPRSARSFLVSQPVRILNFLPRLTRCRVASDGKESTKYFATLASTSKPTRWS